MQKKSCNSIFSSEKPFITFPKKQSDDDIIVDVQCEEELPYDVDEPNKIIMDDAHADKPNIIITTEMIKSLWDAINKINNTVYFIDDKTPTLREYERIIFIVKKIKNYPAIVEALLNILNEHIKLKYDEYDISALYFTILKGSEFYIAVIDDTSLFNLVLDNHTPEYYHYVDRIITTHKYILQ